MKEIAEIEFNGKWMKVVLKENGMYDVFLGDELKQPNHDAEGVIRYLMHCLHNLNYQKEKIEKNLLQKSNSEDNSKIKNNR